MKQVPFYSNNKDDNRCMLACYGSVVEYYTDKIQTWNDLKRLTGFKDKAVWSLQALINVSDLGIQVKMFEPFDYRAYQKDGLNYYKSFLTPQEYEWQIKNAELPDIKLLPDFFKKINWQKKSADLQDIDKMLNNDMVIIAGLDSGVLDNHEFSSHAVLIIDKEENNYIVHDPGLPPKPYRKIEKSILLKAMGGPNHNNEVTGFGKK